MMLIQECHICNLPIEPDKEMTIIHKELGYEHLKCYLQIVQDRFFEIKRK